MRIGVLILAAGYSKRMRENKALLKFDDDYTFLDQLITQHYLAGVYSIKIISQTDKLPLHKNIITNNDLQIQFLKNDKPELGRSYSISTGLKEFKSIDFVFLQNIDNPFTSKDLLKKMISNIQEDSIIVPQVEKRNSHPILIPYQLIHQLLKKPKKDFDFRNFFTAAPKQFVNWDNKNIKANINTQDDYHHWIK